MSHLLEKSHIYLCLSQSKYWNVKSRSMSQNKVRENVRTITILQRTLFDVNFSRTDVNLYQSHWSVKSRSRSAGPTVYSKNMQRTVTMQCLITVIIAAEKFTLMLIVDGRMTDANLNSYVTPCLKEATPLLQASVTK